MPENKNQRNIDMTGSAKKSVIIAGDSNIVNIKGEQAYTKLLYLITIALISIGLTIILFGYFSAETKAARTDFVQIIITIVIASGICMGFILILSKAYRNISIKALMFILIPLCMMASVSSAAFLLDENVLHIIGRIIFPSDENICPSEPDSPIAPPCSKTYNEIKVERPDPIPPKSGDSVSTVIQDSSDSGKPPGLGSDTPTSQVSRRSGKTAYLRSEPITVSDDEAERVFRLKRDSNPFVFLRPLEYIQNNFEDNGDGTITDQATGLMWQKSGSPDWVSLKDVPAYIEKLNREKFAGYSDWRLPTVDELKSLLTQEKQSNGRYINPIFDEKKGWCWTSDKRASGGAWHVNFDDGNVYWISDDYNYVRAVRSRQ